MLKSVISIVFLVAALASAQAVLAQGTADEFYEDARRYEANGEIDAALIQLKNALQQDDQHMPSMLLFAELQRDRGFLAASEQTYSDALLLGADPNFVVPRLADVYQLQGRNKQLIDELDPQQVTGSARAELLGYHALAHAQLGETIQSRRKLREALEIDAGARAPNIAQLAEYLAAGDEAAALSLSQELLDRFYDDARLWHLRALVLIADGDREQARRAFDRALELDEGLGSARFGRTELALIDGDLDSATADIAFLKEQFPFDPRTAYLEAQLLDIEGDPAAARELYRRAADLIAGVEEGVIAASQQLTVLAATSYVRIDGAERAIELLQGYQQSHSDNTETGKMLADLLLDAGAGGDALSVLDPLLKTDPNSIDLRARKARALALRGDHRRAVSEWQSLQQDGYRSLEVDAAIAESQIRYGELSEGVAGLQRVLAQAPALREQRLLLANTLLDIGRLRRSRQHAQYLLSAAPKDARYLSLMGRVHALSGDSARAAEFFRAAQAAGGDHLALELELVDLDRQTGELTRARENLRRLEKQFPDAAGVQRARTRVELDLGNTGEALRYIERAMTSEPTSLESVQILVEIQFAQQKARDALQSAGNFAKRFGDNLDAQFFYATVLRRVGNTAEAITQYKIISRKANLSNQQLYRVAMAQVALGAYEDASAVLFAATRAAPDVRVYREATVDLLLRMESYTQALQQARTLAADYPNEAFPQVLTARAQLALGDYPEAARALQQAQALVPGNRGIVLARQHALVRAGKGPEARALLAQWLQSHPDDEQVRMAYGSLFLQMQQLADAEEQFRMLTDAGSSNPLVLNNLAWVQAELGDPTAVETARRAHALGPELSQTSDTLGWILAQQGALAEALPFLREAVARRSDSGILRYHLGSTLAELGRTPEAIDQLRRALSLELDDRQRNAVQSLLDTLN